MPAPLVIATPAVIPAHAGIHGSPVVAGDDDTSVIPASPVIPTPPVIPAPSVIPAHAGIHVNLHPRS
jgi:hypothetical protein